MLVQIDSYQATIIIYLFLPLKYYLFQILKNGSNKFCDRDTTEVSDDAEDKEEIRRLQMEIKRQRIEKKIRKERQRLELQSDGLTDTAGTTDQSASPGYSDTDCDHGNTDHILDSNDEDFLEAETVTIKFTDTLTE